MACRIGKALITINAIHEKYLFRKKLGRGSFGDAFLAVHRKTGGKVVVKMTRVNSGDIGLIQFQDEMMRCRQLDHPNIAKVLDYGETDTGLLFIAFEYIRGENLAQVLRREGALPLVRVMALMGQVLSALNGAHTRNIIHRNLKPENIMIVTIPGNETVKILDFGICVGVRRYHDSATIATGTQEFSRTPAYAAPEQLRGEPVSVTGDLYVWGLLFLECIIGRSPFTGLSDTAVVRQQLADRLVRIPDALINHQLGELLQWTLEKNVEFRANDASVVASRLRAVSLEGINL